MFRTAFTVLFAMTALLGISVGTTTAQTIYGRGGNREFVSINKATGASTLITTFPAPFAGDAMAFRGANLYAWDASAARLAQIDPLTGAILTKINVGPVSPATGIGDIAFHSNGLGYLSLKNKLWKIDFSGPSVTLINGSFHVMSGLAFDSSDVLYGLGGGTDRIFTIDINTGIETIVGNTGVSGSSGGITFDSTGILYMVVDSNFYTVNKATGLATKVGNTGVKLTALACQRVVAATAGVTIVESGGSTDVAEGGATDTYTVVLNTAPTANVTITLTTDAFVSVAAGTLTFTPGNWSVPQTVTVTAVDDLIPQGPHTGTIKHTATSADPIYNGISITSVVANVADNDSAKGVTIIQPSGSTDVEEGGATDGYWVVLNSAPGASVTITPITDGQELVFPTSLTFTPGNWSTKQYIDVTAVNWPFYVGFHTGVIRHSAASTDAGYNGIAIANVIVNITDLNSPPPPANGEGSYSGSGGPAGGEGGFGFGRSMKPANTPPPPAAQPPILSSPFRDPAKGNNGYVVRNIAHQQTAGQAPATSKGIGAMGWTLLTLFSLGATCMLTLWIRSTH